MAGHGVEASGTQGTAVRRADPLGYLVERVQSGERLAQNRRFYGQTRTGDRRSTFFPSRLGTRNRRPPQHSRVIPSPSRLLRVNSARERSMRRLVEISCRRAAVQFLAEPALSGVEGLGMTRCADSRYGRRLAEDDLRTTQLHLLLQISPPFIRQGTAPLHRGLLQPRRASIATEECAGSRHVPAGRRGWYPSRTRRPAPSHH
jgi:hypothetical protein